jgi:CubicO group peptidase (beta-lactamase class C family)
VIEKASGMPFEEYMRTSVWGPAGMLATRFDVPERLVPHRARSYFTEDGRVRNVPFGDLTYKFASGGMMSTAEDLVRLGAALNAGRLLKHETVALMYSPQIQGVLEYRKDGPPARREAVQALMWRVGTDDAKRRFVYHCGAVQRFHSCLVNYPEQDVVVALLANSYDTNGWKENLAIAEFFLEGPKPR